MKDKRTINEDRRDECGSASGWDVPLRMAALGLLLMLGGYAAMNYVPSSPRRADQERQLVELREMAAKSGTTGKTLDERLKQMAPAWRTPPYQLPGRLALYIGLALFVAAGVRMYRNNASPPKEVDEAE